MIFTQNIPLNFFNKNFISEKLKKISFIYFDNNKDEIKIKLIEKSRIGYSKLIE